MIQRRDRSRPGRDRVIAGDVTAPAFDAFDERRCRASPAGPDPAVIAQVRGDRNRVFLMD